MLKYTGGGFGGAIVDVPARDLSDKDLERLESLGWTKQKLIETKLYEESGHKFGKKE